MVTLMNSLIDGAMHAVVAVAVTAQVVAGYVVGAFIGVIDIIGGALAWVSA